MNGPGELTLTSIVLFTLGAYGVAAGAASGQQSVVAVGVFGVVVVVGAVVVVAVGVVVVVVVLPAASRPTAVNVCEPLPIVVVFQAIHTGVPVTSDPTFTPSTLNCTPAPPTGGNW